MTPKKRAKITEDVLRAVHERCQRELPRIRADLEREYWEGDPLPAQRGPWGATAQFVLFVLYVFVAALLGSFILLGGLVLVARSLL